MAMTVSLPSESKGCIDGFYTRVYKIEESDQPPTSPRHENPTFKSEHKDSLQKFCSVTVKLQSNIC